MGRRVVIIGGGASGLMAAIQAARNGASVTVLERNDRPGKKLLVTGNGRCNLTNLTREKTCYRGGGQDLAWKATEKFTPADTISFFSSLGIYTQNRNGWIYPNSGQASSVLQVLLLEAMYRKVKIKTRETVLEVKKEGKLFLTRTETWTYESEAVILACGSPASQVEGSSDAALAIAGGLGHRTIPFLPALVPLKGQGRNFPKWAGVRVHAAAELYVSGKQVCREEGEVQLTDYGISGIPVFQLSRYAVCAAQSGENAVVSLDFLPGYERDSLRGYLEWRREQCPYKTLQQSLIGLLPDRLLPLVAPEEEDLSAVTDRIKDYPVIIRGAASLGQAQVCSGGVCAEELTENMESRLVPGFYVTGEAADVDGACGGYNLQWAWSSGAAAGMHSAKGEQEP
jgi:predicted Rossmann fold flavoprotein